MSNMSQKFEVRKMSAQAVANQPEVPDVPEVLENLMCLEV